MINRKFIGPSVKSTSNFTQSSLNNVLSSNSGVWGLNDAYLAVKSDNWSKANYGLSSDNAGLSAQDIKNRTGTNTNGVYWINLPTVGPTQIYCIMDSAYNGGGWMMAMKATRGTTFPYSSTYWTAVNTLNPTAYDQNDGDAKFNTFNYFQAKDMLARWPDIGSGGSIAGLGSWIWLQNDYYSGTRSTLINFFANAGVNRTVSAGKSFSGWASGVFSSQSGNTFYGYNFTADSGKSVRWGFGWNNETDWASNDVSGGIGMAFNSYSAGDSIGCCQDTTGINRTARVEIYVR